MGKEAERQAMLFALAVHDKTTYSSGVPYLYHLYNVVQNVQDFMRDRPQASVMIQAAWLHDTIEDTTVSYSQIKQKFGAEVAELVYLATDELGRSHKERKAKTWPKLIECLLNQPEGMILKLADIIANVENAVHTKNKIIFMYQKEYPEFRTHFKKYPLDCDGDPWGRLDDAFRLSVAGLVLSDEDNFAGLIPFAKKGVI